MKRVLVLDANQRSGLAVTRSLGKRGVSIITADEAPHALAGASRFSSSYCSYPSPRTTPEKFISFLSELIKTQGIEILFPMTELTAKLILEFSSSLPNVTIPFPNKAAVESLSDKCSLLRRAAALNIPIPNTWYADSPARLPHNLNKLPYPLVLKPGMSWLLQNNGWARNSVHIASNPLIAKEFLNSNPAFTTHPFMLQEFISGYGQGVFALYDRGKPLAFFSHLRLREKPPSGGVSVLSESIPINPKLLEHSRRLLDNANWHGVAMVEFKVDEKDGTPYLMEINTRFWGSLQLAIDAGVDFPWLLYKVACNEQPEIIESYKTGIRLRWLLGDLDNLYLTLRDRNTTIGTKLYALFRFLMPSPFKTRHEVYRWNDLGPFWYEIKQYMANLIR